MSDTSSTNLILNWLRSSQNSTNTHEVTPAQAIIGLAATFLFISILLILYCVDKINDNNATPRNVVIDAEDPALGSLNPAGNITVTNYETFEPQTMGSNQPPSV